MTIASRFRILVIAGTVVSAVAISCGKAEDATTEASSKEGTDSTSPSGSSGTSGSSGSTSTSSCTATASTTATATLNTYGCALLTRDTSSCKASREAQGLSGYWLKFSCSVTLTKSGNNVVIATKNIPDSKSFYYSSTDACYEAFSSTARKANPNKIATKNLSITVPYAPSAASNATATPEGVIGVALNGVAIYDNSAAPGDDIYNEEATFDKCDGHPDMSSTYHYHTEPSTISSADAAFVGVLRDGFPIYGRNDYATGTVVTGLDAQGGKTGKTIDSPNTDVYHYHVNLQSNGTKSAYFISAGYYKGTVGACTGCQ